MDNNKMEETLNLAISLEKNIAVLYNLYSNLFPDDSEFWWELSNEEKNHASLLESATAYLKIGRLPESLLRIENHKFKRIVNEVTDNISSFKNEKPDKEKAYNFALELESSAYEAHFQKIMTNDSENMVIKILKNLNKDDKDHFERIKNHMNYEKIKVNIDLKT